MSSKSIYESQAKELICNENKLTSIRISPYSIVRTPEHLERLVNPAFSKGVVCKPDQLIKRRGKLGLVKITDDIVQAKVWLTSKLNQSCQIGRSSVLLNRFILEPCLKHEQSTEFYVCIYTSRLCNTILFCQDGGVDVGDVDAKAKKFEVSLAKLCDGGVTEKDILESDLLSQITDQAVKRTLSATLAELHRIFAKLHFAYLEINPLVVTEDQESGELCAYLLDAAAKLDQCAEFLFSKSTSWLVPNDFTGQPQMLDFPAACGATKTPEEAFIADLDARSGSSLKLTVLNPEGRVWTMNAGGGASVIYADTVCQLAPGGPSELANYGEYSGAPSEEQTFEYAKTIVQLMTKGEPRPDGKILLVGGGIANFTNVAATFKGIVRAIRQFEAELKRHRVTIFVRRGGPNYLEGLRTLRQLGCDTQLPIHVYGPETHMTAIVGMAFGLTPVQPSSCTEPVLAQQCVNSGGDGVAVEPTAGSLMNAQSRCIVWGLQLKAVQSMLDFDFASRREEPSVAALIYPFSANHESTFYWGREEIRVPVYKEMKEAFERHQEATILVNFASLRQAFSVTLDALSLAGGRLRLIAIIAEGIPENLTRRLIHEAASRGVTIVGPATVGGLRPGCFKIGNSAGGSENVLAAKLHRQGSVAYVSRSGGMSNELNNMISMNADGVAEGIAIGGDRYPASTFMDHLLRYEADSAVHMTVLLGEVGGMEEWAVANAIETGQLTKPVIAWCVGTCAEFLAPGGATEDVQFGHAGACARSPRETAAAKNARLREAGAIVPDSFDQLHSLIRKVYTDLVASGRLTPKPYVPPRTVPMDYAWAQELGLVRRPTHFRSSIVDDRGAELNYAGVPISDVVERGLGVPGTLGLLWFKRLLPDYFNEFLELCLVLTADHGPAVSGAHNTIVAARAGKDLVSSLASGLLTIGDRFGGALDAAAKQFSQALDAGEEAADFVDRMRAEGRLIMGIGHRVKSVTNPDQRVQLLLRFVREHFPTRPTVDFALRVEQLTTAKRPNLILNVDGVIGVAMVDLLRHSGHFSKEEAAEYIEIGALNGLFVLGRTMGFIGHFLDQKRLRQGLYRHPWDDISYNLPKPQ